MADFIQHLDYGITVIDTGFVRPQFDASYLIVENGRAAFVETGPNAAVPRLLAALQECNLDRSAVDYVIPTHIHLDHAGGAGLLMQQLPQARLVVHPRGARHMIDPSALMQGVRAVYGEEAVARDYGELVPVSAARVIEAADGMVLDFNGRALKFMDTPGHARHHFCVWDETSRGWFTGDTLGLAYPYLATPTGPYVAPATAPVQFDPVALRASIVRLLAARPDVLFLTHFGALRHPQKIAAQLLRQIDAMVVAARRLATATQRHERLKRAFTRIYLDEWRRCGATQDEEWLTAMLAIDIELNAQGLGVWLDKP